jgi:hypothetical protein
MKDARTLAEIKREGNGNRNNCGRKSGDDPSAKLCAAVAKIYMLLARVARARLRCSAGSDFSQCFIYRAAWEPNVSGGSKKQRRQKA